MSGDPCPSAGEAARSRRIALGLMRLALALLDRVGDLGAASRLQHAIDTAEGSEAGAAGEGWAVMADALAAGRHGPADAGIGPEPACHGALRAEGTS